jgi:hypothetical protein
MQVKNEIIANFRNFIQLAGSLSESQKILKDYRNIIIGDLNLKESRCVWMCLLLYKFKNDMEVSEDLWNISRQLIISLLKSDEKLKSVITNYLKIFTEWQNEDLKDFITEIGINYYNLLQIKNSIEKTENNETIEQWIPHYNSLIQQIRTHCKTIGILEKLDDFVFTFEQQKYDIVKEIMNKAYWNKIEEEIKENNLDGVYSNLTELKTILLDIIPKSVDTKYLDEYFDIEYIKHLVNNGVFDKEYLIKLFIFVMKTLQEWDSMEFSEKYEKEMKNIEQIEGLMHLMVRNVLEKTLVYSVDLKNRKALWNIILKK